MKRIVIDLGLMLCSRPSANGVVTDFREDRQWRICLKLYVENSSSGPRVSKLLEFPVQ